MSDTIDLKQVANAAANDDDATIILDRPEDMTKESETPNAEVTPIPVSLDEEDLESPEPVPMDRQAALDNPFEAIDRANSEFTPEQAKLIEELLKDMPEEEKKSRARDIFTKAADYQKEMIIEQGLTKDEARTAYMNRIKKELNGAYEDYKKEHPDVGVITINKETSPDKLGLTKEEHEKLSRVKRIRLVACEDVELKQIELETPPEDHLIDYIRSIDTNLAKFAVPLPIYGDYVTFKGAQIMQLASVMTSDDMTVEELLSNEASLIYNCLADGKILHKFDEKGINTLSYNEFLNVFPYQDVDMAMYAILCASTMDETTTEMQCPVCNHSWSHKYLIKSLLDMEDASEYIKTRIDKIIGAKSNPLVLEQLYKNSLKAKRYKSPVTDNIFELSYPTVARVLEVMSRIAKDDPVINYLSSIAIFIRTMYIKNAKTGKYVKVDASDTTTLLHVLRTLGQDDVRILSLQINENMFYTPKFSMEIKCPACQHHEKLNLSIANMLFWRVQDSAEEIMG